MLWEFIVIESRFFAESIQPDRRPTLADSSGVGKGIFHSFPDRAWHFESAYALP